jgi:hypothetical protein
MDGDNEMEDEDGDDYDGHDGEYDGDGND